MTQYDAGPGDLSDREWEVMDRPPRSHARRRRGPTLPPWALIALLVGIIILLCVSLVLIVQALRGRGEKGTPTPQATVAPSVAPTGTIPLALTPTDVVAPTATVTLPVEIPATPTPEGIAPGAMVVVQGTKGAGLNIREQPTTYAKILGHAKEGTVLQVLDGPRESDGYVWWKVRTPDGVEGWGAENWLVLKTE